MPINEKTIQEMQEALREDYGRDVTQAEASEITHALVGYFDLLAKIHHREKIKNEYENAQTKNKWGAGLEIS